MVAILLSGLVVASRLRLGVCARVVGLSIVDDRFRLRDDGAKLEAALHQAVQPAERTVIPMNEAAKSGPDRPSF